MSYRQQNTNYQDSNPYTNAPIGGPEYGSGNGAGASSNPAQPALTHEMSNYSQTSSYSTSAPPPLPTSGAAPLSTAVFLKEVDGVKAKIKALGGAVGEISTLHQRALSSPDTSASNQLTALVAETQRRNHEIKESIKFLERDVARDPSSAAKVTQARNLKNEFKTQLKAFQGEEYSYQKSYKEAQKRQWLIVNPDATDQELEDISVGSEGVFATALKSNRSGQVSTTLGNVRARHNEIQKIEQTLTELGAMFAELAQVVEVQEPMVQQTEANAEQTVQDVEGANKQLNQGILHARNRNKLKWWCLLITILIVLGIALGVGLGIGLTKS